MEKTRKHIESALNSADNSYWDLDEILHRKKEELRILQSQVNGLQDQANAYDAERKYYQELLDELNTNQNG